MIFVSIGYFLWILKFVIDFLVFVMSGFWLLISVILVIVLLIVFLFVVVLFIFMFSVILVILGIFIMFLYENCFCSFDMILFL